MKCDPICLTVDEDDISTLHDGLPGGSLGNHPDDGNSDGSFTGDPGVDIGGPATVSGKLAGLFGVVQSGADEPLTFGFVSDAARRACRRGRPWPDRSQVQGRAHQLRHPGLWWRTDPVRLCQRRRRRRLPGAANDRLVFKFTLETDGDFKFEQFDQLDHDPPNDDSSDSPTTSATRRARTRTSTCRTTFRSVDITSLNFGLLINATDFDGDCVNLKDQLIIKIRDDVPEIAEKVCLDSGHVLHRRQPERSALRNPGEFRPHDRHRQHDRERRLREFARLLFRRRGRQPDQWRHSGRQCGSPRRRWRSCAALHQPRSHSGRREAPRLLHHPGRQRRKSGPEQRRPGHVRSSRAAIGSRS